MNNFIKFLLNRLNIHPDKNQRWILLSTLISGLMITYINPRIVKTIVSELPAEWLAIQSLVGALTGFSIGILWQKAVRQKAVNNFMFLAAAESLCGCILGLYLTFISWDVWVFAISSLIYSSMIGKFISKCKMTFKSKLWTEGEREIYDNNNDIVGSIVCILGFLIALILMPSLKTSLIIWSLYCIFDDLGWIIVFYKNKQALKI